MNLPCVFWLQKNYPNIKVNKLKEYEVFKKPYLIFLIVVSRLYLKIVNKRWHLSRDLPSAD